MPTYLVGARWWCPRCWRRGTSPTCPACALPGRDLVGGWSAVVGLTPEAGGPAPC